MAKRHMMAIENLGRYLEKCAGVEARARVLEGSENLARGADSKQIALWIQGAMKRLDGEVDKKTRGRVMEQCGRSCAEYNRTTIERVKAKRKKYKSLDEFLEAEKRKLLTGMRLERKGKILYQYYMPRAFAHPMRCFCSLLRGLPPEEEVSPTFCQCSKGFVKEMWEDVLGKPVKVEVLASAVTGAKECKFKIWL